MISHYNFADSAISEWLTAVRELETEGERTPIQTDPDPAVLDETTPMLLRRQAA